MDPNEFKPKLLFFSLKESISRGADGFSSEDEVIDGLYDTKKGLVVIKTLKLF